MVKRVERDPLTPDTIYAAALDILDREGEETLTMRRLANALGTAHTAIYWHVPSRDDLLRGAVDLAMRRIELPALEGPWEDQAMAVCRSMRAAFLRHPDLQRLSSRFPTASSGAILARLNTIFRSAGFDRRDASLAVANLLDFTNGSTPIRPRDRATLLAQWNNVAFAGTDVLDDALAFDDTDRDAAFEQGLTILVTGWAARSLDRRSTAKA